MKKFTLAFLLISAFLNSGMAQFTNVTYDLQRNWFNEGQPLPAEKSMVFKGMADEVSTMVELSVLGSKGDHQLYTATWFKTNTPELSINVPFKLRASDEYDFALHFFKPLDSKAQQKLQQQIIETLHTYLEVNMTGDKSIKFTAGKKKILREMNALVAKKLVDYRSKKGTWQVAFSDMVALKIEQLEQEDLDKEYIKKDSTMSRQEVRTRSRQKMVDDLKSQISNEVIQFLDTELYVLHDSRYIDNYPTEKKENSLALNIGFGGVYLSGNWDDFTYGSSPYLGIAFPLGNSVLGSKFLSNTSVTLGVFTENFTDANDNEVTGFIVDRPIYLGLDHKLFKFIRINAGAAFLEGWKESTIAGVDPTKEIMIRPYVGLSARVDLSIGFGK